MDFALCSSPPATKLNLQDKHLDLFQAIISTMAEGIFLASVSDNTFIYANPKFEKIFGYGEGELKNAPAQTIIKRLCHLGSPVVEVEMFKKNATPFWARSRTTQVEHNEFGTLWLVIVEDITLVRKAEEKALCFAIQEAYELERNRISQELHDELGQLLTVLKMELFDLKQKELTDLLPTFNERIGNMEGYVHQLIHKVRTIVHEKRPAILEKYDFESGIKLLVNDLTMRTGKQLDLEINLQGATVNNRIAKALFRILQEALTNSLRHSQSNFIKISLQKTSVGFCLWVRDLSDCCPVSEKFTAKGFGISGMKERAERLGGTFSIWCEGGVNVKVEIPDRVVI